MGESFTHRTYQMKTILSIGIVAASLITGCTVNQSKPLSFTELQIDYVATSRCLYKEGILTREQLTQRMERDSSNDPNGFMDPIVKSSQQGTLTRAQNERVMKAIESIDCPNRVLSWAAIELPEDKAAEFVMIYMADKDSE